MCFAAGVAGASHELAFVVEKLVRFAITPSDELVECLRCCRN
jgi:hypothetical protein